MSVPFYLTYFINELSYLSTSCLFINVQKIFTCTFRINTTQSQTHFKTYLRQFSDEIWEMFVLTLFIKVPQLIAPMIFHFIKTNKLSSRTWIEIDHNLTGDSLYEYIFFKPSLLFFSGESLISPAVSHIPKE